MTNEIYKNLDQLVGDNKELKLKLQLANDEIASLKIMIEQLESGQLKLAIKLEDSESEVGRLDMVLKHRYEDIAIARKHKKFGK